MGSTRFAGARCLATDCRLTGTWQRGEGSAEALRETADAGPVVVRMTAHDETTRHNREAGHADADRHRPCAGW